MCMHTSAITPQQKWRWAGDAIVTDSAIEGARTVPGSRKRGYRVDIREFLGLHGSAVVRGALDELRKDLSADDAARFGSRAPGSFDLRASLVTDFVARKVKYVGRGRLARDWLFPAETLAAREGDCEDIAFLLAAMLEASGISPYCLRVAFGTVHVAEGTGEREHDHVWVVYFNEAGAWEILEPVLAGRVRGKKPAKPKAARGGATHLEVDYAPHFVMNRAHLWEVRTKRRTRRAAAATIGDYLGERRFWRGFDPTFAASVHEGIFDDALAGLMSAAQIARVKRVSLAIDVDTLEYDPRDHFDFAYIDDGWARVDRRVRGGDFDELARALHGVGDFYAHSTYADFGARDRNGNLLPYDPRTRALAQAPAYDFRPYFDAHGAFPGSDVSAGAAAAMWAGQIISGQWWRWYTTYPNDIQTKAELARHRALPDHDWLAVDGPKPHSGHVHYDDEATYATQFADRRACAVRHVRSVWQDWCALHGAP